eukprot:347894-Chlamydomonas_euryale.AAC.2
MKGGRKFTQRCKGHALGSKHVCVMQFGSEQVACPEPTFPFTSLPCMAQTAPPPSVQAFLLPPPRPSAFALAPVLARPAPLMGSHAHWCRNAAHSYSTLHIGCATSCKLRRHSLVGA